MSPSATKQLRHAYHGLSETLYRANIVGEDQQAIGDAMHVLHVAVHEATTERPSFRERIQRAFAAWAA